jgi:hypothetical protein
VVSLRVIVGWAVHTDVTAYHESSPVGRGPRRVFKSGVVVRTVGPARA